jgi:cellulose synthase (UDP-forming)
LKLANLGIVIAPFVLALLITIYTMDNIITSWIAYGLWLAIVCSAFMSINFILLYLRGRKISTRYAQKMLSFRIAAFVTSYNEDPSMVKGTLLSVKLALGDLGDVYLLDDSTKKEIVEDLRSFCEKNGIFYIHREDRKGYKAGAINNALKLVGDQYDLVAIFDSDQRPVRTFFREVIPYFYDPSIAFVQIPQRYTEKYSGISLGAAYQQKPFLRVIMRGRSYRSAFSLGSGTVFRINALKEVGFFPEYSITEDVAVSIELHSRGWRSLYIDENLIWYGEAPPDLASYLTQQARWALGYLQYSGGLLKSSLKPSQFFDYLAGTLYWLKEGPLTVFEILAPMVFLITGLPIVRMDPLLYVLLYVPYLSISIALFIYSFRGKDEYGLKGFLYHQAVEYIALPSIVGAFVSWFLRRRVPFKVTPKGSSAHQVKSVILHMAILALLILSIVKGIVWLFSVKETSLIYSIAINIFWALYHTLFLFLGIVLSPTRLAIEPYTEVIKGEAILKGLKEKPSTY